ncbi:hypothetical protein TKV_c21780 [Thermoanaerobacter kivui]|uniref:Uncharacterized protein n=2 Tax=Thermoanaerobacter kivui TaxID=2325 RepID=A0A097AU28_THEKI|nr:hypothetical protein TKV_c21780 [Thermoanaerobacter kivui]
MWLKERTKESFFENLIEYSSNVSVLQSPPSFGLWGIIMGLSLLAAVFLRYHIHYSISFTNFLLSFINPLMAYNTIKSEIFVYLPMIWIGWAFITDGIVGMIRDKIVRKTQHKQTLLLVEAVIQVLFPFISVLFAVKSIGIYIVVLFVGFLVLWNQLFVHTVLSFLP